MTYAELSMKYGLAKVKYRSLYLKSINVMSFSDEERQELIDTRVKIKKLGDRIRAIDALIGKKAPKKKKRRKAR